MIDMVIKPKFKRSPETRREMRPCISRAVRVHDRLEGRDGRGMGQNETASRDGKEMVALSCTSI